MRIKQGATNKEFDGGSKGLRTRGGGQIVPTLITPP